MDGSWGRKVRRVGKARLAMAGVQAFAKRRGSEVVRGRRTHTHRLCSVSGSRVVRALCHIVLMTDCVRAECRGCHLFETFGVTLSRCERSEDWCIDVEENVRDCALHGRAMALNCEKTLVLMLGQDV